MAIDEEMNELSQVLDTVSEKVPKLIKMVTEPLYSPQTGETMGKAAGAFRKGLVESGLDEASASRLTALLSPTKLFSSAFFSRYTEH